MCQKKRFSLQTCALLAPITFFICTLNIFNLILHFKPKISTSFGPKGFTFCHNFALKNLEYVCEFFFVCVWFKEEKMGEEGGREGGVLILLQIIQGFF